MADVVACGLCVRCGTCIGLCPSEAATATWDDDDGWGISVADDGCNGCGICLSGCPGLGIDLDRLAEQLNLGRREFDLIGRFDALYGGWAANWETRWRGSSGGLCTTIVEAALESGLADAALLTSFGGRDGLMLVPFHARSADEVRLAAGSKYCMVPLNSALRNIESSGARYIVVGLPCHVQGLRLAQEVRPRLVGAVVGAISLLCGMVQTPSAASSALRRAGIAQAQGDKVLRVRGKGWPGIVEVQREDGSRAIARSRDFYDARFQSQVLPRCKSCVDATGELADVSLGDAWPARGACPSGLGESIAIVRGARGTVLLENARQRLVLHELSPEAIQDHQQPLWRLKQVIVPGLVAMAAVSGSIVPQYPTPRLRTSARGLVAAAAWEAKRRTLGRRDSLHMRPLG